MIDPREERLNIARDRRALREWLESQREKRSSESELLESFVNLLGPIFDYLGDGYRYGTLERRAWMLLYALRPDLLNGESMADAARRFGVSKPAIHFQLESLRKALPALSIDTDTRKGHASDKVSSNERHRQANLKTGAMRVARRSLFSERSFDRAA